MTKYYTPYELVQRLDAIATVEIHSFEEVVELENEYTAEVIVHFPSEFDDIAYTQLQSVIDDASNWMITENESPESEPITIDFSIDRNAPTPLLDKFELI